MISTEIQLGDQIAEKANRMLELPYKLEQAASVSERSNLEQKNEEIGQFVYKLYVLKAVEIQVAEQNNERQS